MILKINSLIQNLWKETVLRFASSDRGKTFWLEWQELIAHCLGFKNKTMSCWIQGDFSNDSKYLTSLFN